MPKSLIALATSCPFHLPFLRQRVKRGDDGGLGVHFEEAPQSCARVAAAKTVRAQRHQSARHPRRNLVGHQPHVIRNRDKGPLLFRQQRLDVGFLRRFRRVQHVPAFAAQRIGTKQFVTRRAPDIGRHAVAFSQNFLRLQRRIDDWSAAENVGFEFLAFRAPGLNLYKPFKMPSSTPAGIGGMG